MADVALLERLTLASPRDLVAQTPAAGSTTLAGLYEQCRAAGLTAQPAESDIHRLHALCADGWTPRTRRNPVLAHWNVARALSCTKCCA